MSNNKGKWEERKMKNQVKMQLQMHLIKLRLTLMAIKKSSS